jgi:hypothetical protein
MLAHHVFSEAAYSLTLLLANAISLGDYPEAFDWLQQAENAFSIAGLATQRRAGIYSAKANLALSAGRLDEADAIVSEMCGRYPIVQTPRFGAVATSLALRIKVARGDVAAIAPLVAELQHAYDYGGHLGSQDHIVEALWCAAHATGHANDASTLLTDYLSLRRREHGPPEASLRSVTASDSAWDLYSIQTTSNSTDGR